MTEPTPTSPKLHFISGLPRAGSTLLAGILRQNPRFHAAMTGPVGTMFGVMLNAMGAQNETALFLKEEQKRDLLRGLFDAYYRPQADRAVIFDTNRAWTARLPALLDLYPDAKLLVLRARRRLGDGQHRASGAPERVRAVAAVRDGGGAGDRVQPGRGAGASRPAGGLRLVGAEGGLLRRAFQVAAA